MKFMDLSYQLNNMGNEIFEKLEKLSIQVHLLEERKSTYLKKNSLNILKAIIVLELAMGRMRLK